MSIKKDQTPASLPQSTEAWYFLVRQLNTEIDHNGTIIKHPYLMLLIDAQNGLLLGMDALQTPPKPQQILRFLFSKMIQPNRSTHLKPARPKVVQFERAQQAQTLAPDLAEIGIQARQAAAPGEIDQLVEEIEQMLAGAAEEIPGLLHNKEITPGMVAELFSAAADFFRAAPWDVLSDDQPLAVEFSPPGKKSFVQLMGNSGLQFGLVLYWNWEDLLQVYHGGSDPLDSIPASGWRSFTFESPDHLPQSDLQAVETFDWEIANEEAYPIPATFFPDSIERPTRQELVYYQALLRSIPLFIKEALQAGKSLDPLPFEAEFSTATFDGPMRVKITYPGGVLPGGGGPEALKWSGAKAPEEAGPDASAAQNLMFRAWEASKRLERIRLAKRALEAWPDCSEAYLLLAEDDAETIEDAYDYYVKGVAAGERALGEQFIEMNSGKLGTYPAARPYLRARQGLAECLISMGREEEGLDHYRDLLRLNTPDNQGVRYATLGLLLQMSRDAEAKELLDQYPEDTVADWTYSRALLAFRKNGDSPESNQALSTALSNNSSVPDYLTGKKPIPENRPETSESGDRNEAVLYVVQHFQNWWRTPSAMEWLKSQIKLEPSKPEGDRKRSRRRKGRGG